MSDDHRLKPETMSIEQMIPQATYDKIKDQIVARQTGQFSRGNGIDSQGKGGHI